MNFSFCLKFIVISWRKKYTVIIWLFHRYFSSEHSGKIYIQEILVNLAPRGAPQDPPQTRKEGKTATCPDNTAWDYFSFPKLWYKLLRSKVSSSSSRPVWPADNLQGTKPDQRPDPWESGKGRKKKVSPATNNTRTSTPTEKQNETAKYKQY